MASRPSRRGQRRGGVAAVLAAAVLSLSMQHVLAVETSPAGPTMAGIAWDCSGWHTVVSGDTCWDIWQTYTLTETEFLEWNPDVSAGCASNFWLGYSYCVRVGAPDPTLTGIAANCDKWHTVVSGDTCWDVWQTYTITEAEFLEWNPAVTSGCASNFWAGYSYCVGVNDNLPGPSSSSAAPSSTSASASSSIASSSSMQLNSTTPYSIRYPVTSYPLTTTTAETALPPQRTLGSHPTNCNTWHMVGSGGTCVEVLNLYGHRLTAEQLLEYNPTIGEECDGLYSGWYACVGVQPQDSSSIGWYTVQTPFTEPASTAYPGYVATEVPTFAPSPTQPGIPPSCQNFYQAKAGDNCNSVLAVYDYVSEAQFFAWNPALNDDCQGLWVDHHYCVADVPGAGDLPMPPTVTAAASPTVSGTTNTCQKWYKTRVRDSCEAIASMFGTFSSLDFIAWNPNVGSSCTNIKQDTYYCVGVPGTPTTRSAAITPTVPPALQTQAGVISNCTRFWLVSPSDTCTSILRDSGALLAADLTEDGFYDWNPAVGSNCAGLAIDYHVCVSVLEWDTIPPVSTVTLSDGLPASSSPPESSSVAASSVISSSALPSNTPVTTPTPYMPGMVGNCVRFYFRGSDPSALYCYDIAMHAGIDLSDFYLWNPQVLNDCSGLWADTWYCIGLQGSTPTTISTGLPTPDPTP